MFCVRGFGGRLGFLLFWGLFWLSAWFFWFSGSGLSVCLVPRGSSARLCGGAGGGLRVVPGSGVDVVRPVSIDYRVLVGVGRAGPGCREVVSRGSGCARFFSALLGGGGLGVFFSARRSLVLLVLVPGPQWGSGFRGLGVWGGVGLGWGFFSGFCCSARAGAGSCLVAGVGVGCGLFWFCLESLILAQDERWRRA